MASHALYAKLEQLRGRFIYLESVLSNNAYSCYSGALIELTPDYLTLQVYDDDGEQSSQVTLPVASIARIVAGHRDERELACKVAFARSASL